MRVPAFAAFAGLLIGLTACASTKGASWQDFHMPGADFTVAMPGQPRAIFDQADKNGTVGRGYQLGLPRASYTLIYVASAPGVGKNKSSLDQRLDTARDQFARKMGAKLRNERRFTFADARATELILDGKTDNGAPETIKARLYARRDQAGREILYQVTVIGPVGHDSSPDAARFLDSFHFVTG